MLFLEDHFLPMLPALQARRDDVRRDGLRHVRGRGDRARRAWAGYSMDEPASGADGAAQEAARHRQQDRAGSSAGAQGQMTMLRRLPKILRFVPGTAQDVRAYFLTLQYWLAGAARTSADMVPHAGATATLRAPRAALRGAMARPQPPLEYPEARRATIRACRREHASSMSADLDRLPRVHHGHARHGRRADAALVPASRRRRRITTASSPRWKRAACRCIPAFATRARFAPGNRAVLPEGWPQPTVDARGRR